MILKEKDTSNVSTDARAKAGAQQEKDVAFYLRRMFKDRDDVLVINDLRIEHNDEVAQIDHLVITEIGFCLIESKSIKASVNINKQGEWSRVYKGRETGIPSPIKQVELQEKLLKSLLSVNKQHIIGKILGLQQGFSGRNWATICAVSSDAVIDRSHLSKDLNERVIKSEFVADWVDNNVALKQGIGKRLRAFKSSDPIFSPEELKSIGEFLIGRHTPVCSNVAKTDVPTPVSQVSADSVTSIDQSETLIRCKQCGNQKGLQGKYGKYGYYVHCECGANTSMKTNCPKCKTPMRIKKDKARYTATCECGESFLVHLEGSV